jgi:hypothetical protein
MGQQHPFFVLICLQARIDHALAAYIENVEQD